MSLCSMDRSGDTMNANELADAMEIRASIRRKATSRKSVTEGANDRLADQLEQAATMLRQQQAEIESLKAGKIRAYDNGVEDGRKPNTNPVKELTDEEIIKVYEDMLGVASAKGSAIDFARAILRKASEK